MKKVRQYENQKDIIFLIAFFAVVFFTNDMWLILFLIFAPLLDYFLNRSLP